MSLVTPSIRRFDVNERTMYAEVIEYAGARTTIPLGSAGSIVREEREGRTYAYRYRYRLDGKREKVYVGTDPTAAAFEVEEEQQQAERVRKLRKLGFASADAAATLVLGTLANAGVFTHGGVLVGSHAYGAILNQVGYRITPTPKMDAVEVLRGPKDHAVTLPYLDYLVESPEAAFVLGRSQVVPVCVPSAGRFAVHKLAVSQLRTGLGNPKVEKDLQQAAMLVAMLTSEYPRELERAAAAASTSLKRKAQPAVEPVATLLVRKYPQAAELLRSLLG